MKKRNTLSEEVFHWLLSMGFPVESAHNHSTLQEITIFVADRKQIHLKLVDIGTWSASTEACRIELMEYSWKITELRSMGHEAIVLWEDVWNTRSDIVKSRILSLLGRSERVPGRLTLVRRIDKNTAAKFLNTNHLQSAVSSKTQYGLYLPQRYFRVLKSAPLGIEEAGLLVAVATFSHARIFERAGGPFRSFEMIRFCNLCDITVVGGLDKLIKSFARDFDPGDVMTYADLEWSDGAGYRKLGFEPQKDIDPIVFAVDRESMSRHSLSSVSQDQASFIYVMNQGSRKYVKVFKKDIAS